MRITSSPILNYLFPVSAETDLLIRYATATPVRTLVYSASFSFRYVIDAAAVSLSSLLNQNSIRVSSL